MKIAQIAPLDEAVPPKLYGGTERVVAYLTDALIESGHEVTLFASGDSGTKANLVPMCPTALRLDPSVRDVYAPVITQLESVSRHADEFDVIHSHIDYFGFPLLKRLKVPSVTTLHGRLDIPELAPLYRIYNDTEVASISDSQRRPLPHANFVATVLHGLPEHLLQAGRGGDYAAFLGRISPEKGPDAAISIAARCGLPLKMAAKISNEDRPYYEARIKPLIRQHGVEFIGEIRERDKESFLGNAKALLFPIAWPEPFGLVMIEAMACGTPVVAYDTGSVREILEDGVTGFIVNTEDEAVAALKRVDGLSRSRIRAEFEQRFTAHHMARNYVDLYSALRQVASNARRTVRVARRHPTAPLYEPVTMLAPSIA